MCYQYANQKENGIQSNHVGSVKNRKKCKMRSRKDRFNITSKILLMVKVYQLNPIVNLHYQKVK